jgi:UDP-N-acetylglucosamine 2-epimerase (non-hydrolysing)
MQIAVGGRSRGEQIGTGVVEIGRLLERFAAVVVQGDTNSALAGALAANAREIPLFHVESGLRSYDRRMPEEHNRVLIDHLADMCWAPTDTNVKNLAEEGITGGRVMATGNPIVEAVSAHRRNDRQEETILIRHHLDRRNYALATIHRPENVDNPDRLATVLESLAALSVPVVLTTHPRTMGVIKENRLDDLLKPLHVVPPLGYADFLALMHNSAVVLSDSGGVQEEVSILKVPLVVLRRSTERPEVIGTFAQITESPEEMALMATEVISQGERHRKTLYDIPCPYGDGQAASRMYEALNEVLGSV